ncbi:MAG TPA: alpha-glucan family phosphorylase [Acidimicrobiales bacterium]|nr:alpha-glucan family phosphorylase [Acidimicrobiales bacterium]
MPTSTPRPGDRDVQAAVAALAERLPEPLRPLAAVAYNYRWAWADDGPSVFASLDAERWARVGGNPVRLLSEAPARSLEEAAAQPEVVDRVAALSALVEADLERPVAGPVPAERPVAFLCAEFAVHASLPIYSGGLGVLAGDILKEASDLALPVVAVGLMYRTGYFHQRLDPTGYQHEFWLDSDPERLPCVLLTDDTGGPLKVAVPVDDEDVVAQVWRADVGRVPLYLLDTDCPENSTVGRWITSRLYEGIASVRLAQYTVLGFGGAMVLERLGLDPSVFHINEGHPALALAQLMGRARLAGQGYDEAWRGARERLVFTTHTPVPAGNETYDDAEARDMLQRVAAVSGDADRFLGTGRLDPADPAGRVGMTPLALRGARSTNGVSRRHGEVAREMWQPLFGGPVEDVPITHVTNGVHVPTWLGPAMKELFDQHFGEGWLTRADDPATWAAVDDIPDEALWEARTESRARLVAFIRERSASDRLRRGEPLAYAEAAQVGFDPGRLTIGFARRLAAYKRLNLLTLAPERGLELLTGEPGVQFLFAGKAHPLDEGAKQILAHTFELKGAPRVADHVAFLEDYDLSFAPQLMAGCDLWINVPRPPEEASGTSGMKAALNGALNLSVLDGWWAEGYDGGNGWAIDGDTDPDHEAQDRRHAHELYDLLEREVVPLFSERDDRGIPRGWLAMVRQSLKTNGPRFSATRMVREYADRIYPAPGGAPGPGA